MAKRNQATVLRESAQLNERLSDYSAITRTSARANARLGRLGNWPIYAAAAGSALAMATSASASIIYFGPSNNYGNNTSHAPHVSTPQVNATFHSGNINLDHSGHQLGLFVSAAAGADLASLRGVDKVHIFASPGVSNSFAFAKRFLPGATINGSALAVGEILMAKTHGAAPQSGNFFPNQSGFAGLEITSVGTVSTKHTEYGWIRLEILDGKNGFPNTLEAIDWAFDTTGAAVTAGELAPEPGTMALALLAAGAAGVAALRRRRKQASATL